MSLYATPVAVIEEEDESRSEGSASEEAISDCTVDSPCFQMSPRDSLGHSASNVLPIRQGLVMRSEEDLSNPTSNSIYIARRA